MIDDERVVRTTDYTYFHDSVMVVNDPSDPLLPGLYNFRIEVVVVSSVQIQDILTTFGFIRVLDAPGIFMSYHNTTTNFSYNSKFKLPYLKYNSLNGEAMGLVSK